VTGKANAFLDNLDMVQKSKTLQEEYGVVMGWYSNVCMKTPSAPTAVLYLGGFQNSARTELLKKLYDKQKRNEYYGDKPTPYDNVDEETGIVTANWWKKFNVLNADQRVQIEQIIAEHRFTDEDIDVSDNEIKEVLKFYQIKRDET